MTIEYVNGKKTLYCGEYTVVKERCNFNAIYTKGALLTHRKTWRSATKIALLLSDAYTAGVKAGYSSYEEESYYEN